MGESSSPCRKNHGQLVQHQNPEVSTSYTRHDLFIADRIHATCFSLKIISRTTCPRLKLKQLLVGGFNPLEKYLSKWESSPSRGENKKYLKPPPRLGHGRLCPQCPQSLKKTVPMIISVEADRSKGNICLQNGLLIGFCYQTESSTQHQENASSTQRINKHHELIQHKQFNIIGSPLTQPFLDWKNTQKISPYVVDTAPKATIPPEFDSGHKGSGGENGIAIVTM